MSDLNMLANAAHRPTQRPPQRPNPPMNPVSFGMFAAIGAAPILFVIFVCAMQINSMLEREIMKAQIEAMKENLQRAVETHRP